jgi:hypothetical protein
MLGELDLLKPCNFISTDNHHNHDGKYTYTPQHHYQLYLPAKGAEG